jgi:protein-tyrosine-phosphatase
VLLASSSGLSPMPSIAPETVAIMREIDIDISKHVPTPYEPHAVSYYDMVVNMSGFKLPGKPPKDLIDWQIEDPFQRTPDVYLRVREDLERRVMQLILKLRKQSKR